MQIVKRDKRNIKNKTKNKQTNKHSTIRGNYSKNVKATHEYVNFNFIKG